MEILKSKPYHFFQVSFLVPHETIPARLGLLLTLSLCQINILNSVVKNSPQSGGRPTALVQWNMICLANIFMAILEYSWILVGKKFKNQIKVRSEETRANNKSKPAKTEEEKAQILDKWMLVVLPLIFTFSIVTFCWANWVQKKID